MGKCFFVCFACLSFFKSHYISAEEKSLFSHHTVHQTIEKMLEYHVEHKEFSPMLKKRSVRLFLEQFDPHKIYLLPSELNPFLFISDQRLQEMEEEHNREIYKIYEEVNQVIEQSILRARKIRQKLREKILTCDLSIQEEGKEVVPQNVEDLERKIYHRLVSFLVSEKKLEGVDDFSKEERGRLLDLWEERMERLEKPYMASTSSSSFGTHIVKSFAKSLDAHSSFFSAEEAHDLKTALEKQFEGIGIVLREGVRGIVISNTIKNSPAEKSGKIAKGDILLAVNGKSVLSLPYEEVLERLRGVKGEKVSLLISRKVGDKKEIFLVELTREKVLMEEDRVHFSSVPFASGKIGVIEIPSFYESEDGTSCAKDLKEAISQLKSDKNLLGLIVDIRENSGGFLNQAVKVASLFMSSGVIVVSKYAEGQKQYMRNTDGKVFYQGPLLVLTSKASASAAEIVAQALQDYGIALVVGDERTYGKGTIQYQTVTDRTSDAYFKVTVGRYYTVSGRSTQIEGVKADIVIPSWYSPFNIGEKYLLYPLKNDQIDSVFTDPLDDVSPRSKAWMKKKYVPLMQKKLSFWNSVLPILQSNSSYRQQNDKEFSKFLQSIRDNKDSLSFSQEISEDSDVQMAEVLQIMKDMIFLEKSQKNGGVFRK